MPGSMAQRDARVLSRRLVCRACAALLALSSPSCQPSLEDSIERLAGTQTEREDAQQELLLAQDSAVDPLLAAMAVRCPVAARLQCPVFHDRLHLVPAIRRHLTVASAVVAPATHFPHVLTPRNPPHRPAVRIRYIDDGNSRYSEDDFRQVRPADRVRVLSLRECSRCRHAQPPEDDY